MYHPQSWRTNPAFQKELNKKIISEATVVTVTTEELYQLGKQFNPNTHIVSNALTHKINKDYRKKGYISEAKIAVNNFAFSLLSQITISLKLKNKTVDAIARMNTINAAILLEVPTP